MSKFLKIGDLNFYMQHVKDDNSSKKEVIIPAHHTFIIDCSGSMSYELPQIRKDLFNKIATILKPQDAVSIIWFSGRGQYGVLLEAYSINSLTELNKVKSLIDKYLTPQGLTAFKEPLIELKELISRVRKENKDMVHTMMFLTDGYDNQWSTKEIINAIEGVKEELASATIVEYGWYCNKQLLNEMATAVGGVHTFSQNFDEYEPYAGKMLNGGQPVKRRYIKLDHEAHQNVVFNIVDGDIITYLPNENNEIFVSVDGELELYYFTEEVPNAVCLGGTEVIAQIEFANLNNPTLTALYGAAFAYSRKSDYNMVSTILKFLGDANLILLKANTFGTQKINELEAKFVDCMNNVSSRYIKGYNPDLEPAEDAFCVLDMFDVLMSNDENVWYPRHESFEYKKIGANKVSKKQELSEEQKELLKNLIDSNDLKEAEAKFIELANNAPEELKFIFDEENPSSSFSNLTWNEKRANLSVQVTYKGFVMLPKNTYNLPEKFDTVIFRNYTVVKDGIVHSYRLPVSLSKETFDFLQKNNLLSGEVYEVGKIYILDFSTIPVINRKMVKTLSAEELFKNSYNLLKLQSSNAVYNQYIKRISDGANKGFLDLYGAEATEWLKELGLRDYGFNPPSSIEKSGEEIQVNTLDVKIKGMASVPTKADIEKVEAKLAKGVDLDSLTDKEMLVAPAILEFQSFEKTLTGLSDEMKTKMTREWLYSKAESFRKTKTVLMNGISKGKFLCIVGKSWFVEFKSRDEKSMTLTLDDKDILCSVEDKMETIKI